MATWRDLVQRRIYTGQPIEAGNVRIVPQSQAWVLRWDGMGLGGMLIWQRPLAVRVEQDGRTFDRPIPDITRRVVWACWGAAALFALIGLLRPFGRRE